MDHFRWWYRCQDGNTFTFPGNDHVLAFDGIKTFVASPGAELVQQTQFSEGIGPSLGNLLQSRNQLSYCSYVAIYPSHANSKNVVLTMQIQSELIFH